MNRPRLDIDTYEMWCIDHLDGKLNAEEEEVFAGFVASNPHLKKELEELHEVTLLPQEVSFPLKSSLQKPQEDMHDELLISFIEGEPSAERQVLKALANRPSLAKELAHYRRTILSADGRVLFEDKDTLKVEEQKLVADLGITYAGKEALKKKTGGRLIPLYLIRGAAAAAIALLVGLYFANREEKNRLSAFTDPPVEVPSSPSTEVPMKTAELPPFEKSSIDCLIDSGAVNSSAPRQTMARVQERNQMKNVRREKAPVLQSTGHSLRISNSENDSISTPPPVPPTKLIEESLLVEEKERKDLRDDRLNSESRNTAYSPPGQDGAPTVLSYINQEINERVTGLRDEKITLLDIVQKVANETPLIAMESNHREESSTKRIKVKIGKMTFSRTKHKKQ